MRQVYLQKFVRAAGKRIAGVASLAALPCVCAIFMHSAQGALGRIRGWQNFSQNQFLAN